MKRLTAVITVLAVVAYTAFAAPFGLGWGMTTNDFDEFGIRYELMNIEDNGAVWYKVTKIPGSKLPIGKEAVFTMQNGKGLTDILVSETVSKPFDYMEKETGKLMKWVVKRYGSSSSDIRKENSSYSLWLIDNETIELETLKMSASSSRLSLRFSGPGALPLKYEK